MTQEYFSLGISIHGLDMIHELPASQGAPSLLVDVVGAGACLVEVALPGVVGGQVGYQFRLRLLITDG